MYMQDPAPRRKSLPDPYYKELAACASAIIVVLVKLESIIVVRTVLVERSVSR